MWMILKLLGIQFLFYYVGENTEDLVVAVSGAHYVLQG